MAAKRKVNPELIDDENPEWTAADFARARPGAEVLSKKFLENWAKGGHAVKHVTDAEYEASKRKRGERGPQKTPTKERVTMRLDPEVLSFFRAAGRGWQTRVNSALAAYVAKQQRRAR
jgi:uncharacterized protein (DUF4415 family)